KEQFKAINHTQIANSKLLLVDDIYTTGTTVNQAAKILLERGAKEVKIITLATGRDLNLNKENEEI
ncbi:MAG: phosphoribosyltransferase family protein, partial [Halanaerobacter sp.]